MPYRFRRKDRSVEKAVRRIAREQIDEAVAAIDQGADADQAIHTVRRCCKRLRALVRLVGPAFPAHAEENAAFREIARLVADMRDKAVMTATFDRLAKRYHRRLSNHIWTKLGRSLDDRQLEPPEPADHFFLLAECRSRLMQVRDRCVHWTIGARGWDAIGPGLAKTYKRARKAAARLDDTSQGTRHHELRKQVKYHLHHCQLLHRLAPDQIGKREKIAIRLSDLLGDHHDLAMLERRLRRLSNEFEMIVEAETAAAIARLAQARIDKRVRPLLDALISEKPAMLERGLGVLWTDWHR